MATQYDIIYFNDCEYLLIAVDIGNSRIKLLTGDNHLAVDSSGKLKQSIDNYLSSLPAGRIYYCISSVNDQHLTGFMKCIGTNDKVAFVEDLLKKQKILNFNNIKGIGTDRVLGLIGALSLSAPPLITVDCGTAVTVNALDKDYNCIGGAIFAGAFTQIEALSGVADRLNKIDLNPNLSIPGKCTEEALNSGVILGIAGGIKEIIKRISAEEFDGDEISIIITGGYSEIIAAELENSGIKAIHQPYLVPMGIIKLSIKAISDV